jgi:hypothetical protein
MHRPILYPSLGKGLKPQLNALDVPPLLTCSHSPLGQKQSFSSTSQQKEQNSQNAI